MERLPLVAMSVTEHPEPVVVPIASIAILLYADASPEVKPVGDQIG